MLFIKFDGVDGEAQDKDHKNWSEVHSISHEIHKAGEGATGSARRRGVVQISDISVNKLYDKSSPKLQEAVCTGKVFTKVEIHNTTTYGDGPRVVFQKYELKNVAVTSFSSMGSGGGDAVPTETFSLNFEEIKIIYTSYSKEGKKEGNVDFGWKVGQGQKA